MFLHGVHTNAHNVGSLPVSIALQDTKPQDGTGWLPHMLDGLLNDLALLCPVGGSGIVAHEHLHGELGTGGSQLGDEEAEGRSC